jgi:hypothetical protein
MPTNLPALVCLRAMMLNVNEPEARGVALALQTMLDDLGKGVHPVPLCPPSDAHAAHTPPARRRRRQCQRQLQAPS